MGIKNVLKLSKSLDVQFEIQFGVFSVSVVPREIGLVLRKNHLGVLWYAKPVYVHAAD